MPPNTAEPPQSPLLLRLADIAAWQLPALVSEYEEQPEWIAELPSLQRGAVWRPSQVELLWDSLFRGFPIGSLVVSEKLEKQKSRSGSVASSDTPWGNTNVKRRHLLDGQQRSNAIALGFDDPFEGLSCKPDMSKTYSESILWIDLAPTPGSFPSGGTRNFLFRLTTKGHPWGYGVTDDAPTLGTAGMREAISQLQTIGWPDLAAPSYARPRAIDLWPIRANAPLPLSWILRRAREAVTAEELWNSLNEPLRQCPLPWAEKTASFLESADPIQLTNIWNGLCMAKSTMVAALQIPDETIRSETRQEAGSDNTDHSQSQNLSNVEHLFQRLNNGGTPISAEDLQFSMIKAYWPGVEQTFSQIHPLPMRGSRLASLAARTALATATAESSNLPGPLTVSSLRAIAIESKKAVNKQRLEDFLEISEGTSVGIRDVVSQSEEWLLHKGGDDIGIPPALRTAIAHRSPEVYLLLMVLSKQILEAGMETKSYRKRVLGTATTLHWFSTNQHRAVQCAYRILHQTGVATPNSFNGLFTKIMKMDHTGGLAKIITPSELDALIPKPNLESLQTWGWWEKEIVETPAKDDPVKQQELSEIVWPLACRVIWNKEMLLFAQRNWVCHRFRHFDDADSATWEDHNRPWDYDHLLPQSTFHDVRGALFLKICKDWGWTVGNFHILPFEENRQRGNKAATEFFQLKDPHLMLVKPNELDHFSLSREDVKGNAKAVLAFIQATRRRILAVYEEWFETLQIQRLLCEEESRK